MQGARRIIAHRHERACYDPGGSVHRDASAGARSKTRERRPTDRAEQAMNLQRTATIGVFGAALAAWLASAATSRRAVPPPIVIPTPAVDSRGAELAEEIARLRERMRPTSTPQQPGRNLFTFRAARVQPAAPVAPRAPAIVEAPVEHAALPALKLAGIAEDLGAEGPERTAIISGDGQLFMVKEGDAVTLRYRVAKISVDVVELTDLTDDSVRRLALKP